MTKLNQIYKCEVCGNISEMVHTGAGELVCCGQNMILQEEKTLDEGQEKHLPVIELGEDNLITIMIGEVQHPMEDAHYIEWIEIITKDGKVLKKYLKAGELPATAFKCISPIKEVRAYCNVHGLWTAKP